MTAMQSTLANVRAGRDAMFLPESAVYAEAMRRLAMDPATPAAWVAKAEGAAWQLAYSDPDDREPATAAFLARARELFGEGAS